MTPLIVIAGRPNVGKSTLFNRLIGQRKAITDPTPGVTRDPVRGSMTLPSGRDARVVDTGGITDYTDATNRSVSERARDVMREADVLLLVVDPSEIGAEDIRLMETVRAIAERVVLVANKVDNERRALHVPALHSYGFSSIIAIAAVHGRNVNALLGEIDARLSDPSLDVAADEERDDGYAGLRLAIVGKPNAGKSTLLNALAGAESALVSPTPGTTRDPVEVTLTAFGHELRVVDTAGMRRKARVEESVEYYSVNRAVEAVSQADVALLTVDTEEGLTDQDKKIASVAVRRGAAVVVGLSKWDLLKAANPAISPNDLLRSMTDRIRFQFPILGFAPVVPFSAVSGEGLQALVEKVVSVREQLGRHIPTGRLNAAVASWSEQTVFTVRGKDIRPRYITQTSSNPVRFVLFVNKPQQAPDGYRRFIENRIRSELGFAEVPIDVEIRGS
jgi:GTP-binding protein